GGNTVQLGYTSEGLLTSLTDPSGHVHTMTYDALGRLTKDQDSAGGFSALARIDGASTYSATLTSALTRTTTYHVETLPTGDQRRVNTSPSGQQTAQLTGLDASSAITMADGTTTNALQGADPRWGIQAPLLMSETVQTPGNLQAKVSVSRTVVLTTNTNLLSLARWTTSVTA